MTTKTCSKCNKEKPIEEFHKNKRRCGDYRPDCKECRNAYHKKLYVPGTKYYEKQRAYQKYIKETVLNHYGNKCTCCGETIPKFLTIDHINRDGKTQRKDTSQGSGTRLYKWIIKNNFPTDLQILCFNCNQGRELNNGVCPHLDLTPINNQCIVSPIPQESCSHPPEPDSTPSLTPACQSRKQGVVLSKDSYASHTQKKQNN